MILILKLHNDIYIMIKLLLNFYITERLEFPFSDYYSLMYQ